MFINFNKFHLKMSPSILVSVLIIALRSILYPALARGDDLPYDNCEDSFSCGEIKGIGYPFRLSGQPDYCGHPAFTLHCKGETLIFTTNSSTYRVNDVVASTKILSVSRTDLLGFPCAYEKVNASFDTGFFNYTPNDRNITVLYGCHPHPENGQGGTDTGGPLDFLCATSVAIPPETPPQDVTRTCESVIQVPVLNTSIVFTGAPSFDAVVGAFWQGFELQWIDNNVSRCDDCRKSGGRCGYNRTLEDFTCLCRDGPHSTPCHKPRKKTLLVKLTIGIAVGGALTVPIILGFCIWMKRKTNAKEDSENSGETQLLDLGKGGDASKNGFQGEKPVNPQDSLLMRLNLVRMATNNFSDENKLGRGGFGTVYKGVLPDGREIAIKRLSRNSGQGIVELKNEVMLIARLQHRNLVRLLGCSLEEREKLLIYEYMPNKSIDFFLFDPRMSGSLDWKKRFGIINGVARGLLYLHEDSRLRIIHRDLKTSNILLDHGMNPKISDFGMARIFGVDQDEGSTNRIVGTYGYMAPEYAMGGHFSVKSDVYSFGVLLLEIVSGRKNNSFHLHEHGERSLLDFTWKLWNAGRAPNLIDGSIRVSCDAFQVLKCVHIGLLCVQEDPADRPTMSLVIHMLGGEITTLPRPSRPAFSICRTLDTKLEGEQTKKDPYTVNEMTLSSISPR